MNFERLQGVYKRNKAHILPIKPGMRLEIHEKVGEGDNNRIWKFKGLVLQVKKPNQIDGTFTIRGDVARSTIEKIYPLSFNNFEKVILLDQHKVRRAKLFFMRDKVGKGAKLKSIIDPENKEIDLVSIAKIYAEEEKKQDEQPKEEKIDEIKAEDVKSEELVEDKPEDASEEKTDV